MKTNATDRPLRVCLQQPALPAYRLRFFEAISDHERINLAVLHGDVESVENATSDHLNSTFHPTRRLPLGFLWNAHHFSAVDRKRFDVTVYSANIHYLSYLLGLLVGRLRGMPIVAWGHFRSKKENQFRRLLRFFFTRFADSILCYDERGKQELIQQGVADSRIFVSPNSVDVEALLNWTKIAQESGDVDKLREDLSLCDHQTVIFASRLVPHKKIDLVLDVFSLILNERPDASLILLGDGPDRKRLEEHAGAKGITERTHFVGETYDDKTVATYFAASDVMLYPTNLGLSLMVAAATNTPVVTEANIDKHGPEASWLVHNQNAVLVPEVSRPRFAEATLRVLDDRSLATEIATAARTQVIERYGISRMLEGFIDAIEFAAAARS